MVIDLRALFPETKSLDERSVSALLSALKVGFSDKFDYLNFKQSIQSLSEMGMDQATQFKSAFATAKTLGITKEKLEYSAKAYLVILQKEKESFAEALKKQLYNKVEGKKDELSKIKNRIAENERKIEALKKENATLQEAIDNADEHVMIAREKIGKTRDSFASAFDSLHQTINSDLELISKHL